jgi:hypothetical protein
MFQAGGRETNSVVNLSNTSCPLSRKTSHRRSRKKKALLLQGLFNTQPKLEQKQWQKLHLVETLEESKKARMNPKKHLILMKVVLRESGTSIVLSARMVAT